MNKNKNIDLVILAGGKGSRISRYLKNIPKPLFKFNNISFLQYLLNFYCKYPFKKVYILAGFRGNQIVKQFNNKTINFTKINCFVESKPLGTGGALKFIKKKLTNDFVLINGDSILMHDLNFLFNQKSKLENLIFLTNKSNYSNNKKLSNLDINKEKKVIYNKQHRFMNAGVYFFKKQILSKIKKNNFSLEDEFIPKLIKSKRINGIKSKNFFIDIGTPKNLFKARKLLSDNISKKAIFLDRDGVINHDYGYVHKIENFKFFKGVIKSLKYLIKNKYLIFVITNQAGIAKKKFTYEDFFLLHKNLKHILSQKKVNFDDVQYSPFHPLGKIKKFKKKSILRKPNNGMIKNIQRKFHINLKKSFFIGDKISDRLAAKKSNIYFEYKQNDIYRQIKTIVKKNER